MTAVLERKKLAYEFPWDGRPLRWSERDPLSFDTETTVVEYLNRDCPDLALATASDGTRTVVLRPDQVAAFLVAHKDAHFVFFNASFDVWVLDKYLDERMSLFDASGLQSLRQQAKNALWSALDDGRIRDALYQDMLVRIAKGEGEAAGWSSDSMARRNLGQVARAYCPDADVNKKDPYRLRYGELIGLREEEWDTIDPGFLEYAAGDAYWTWKTYQAMLPVAESLAKLADAEAYPDRRERYGLLTETVQVWASVALLQISRNGMRLDLAKAKAYEESLRTEFQECLAWLDANHPDLFKKYTPAYVKRKSLPTPFMMTKTTLTPKMDTKVLRSVLGSVAVAIGIPVPKSSGKLGLDSISTKPWSDYADAHDFLRRWSSLDKIKKMLGFLEVFRAGKDRYHVKYNVLLRTGRVSAEKPDRKKSGLAIQQAPRKPEFRSLFIPSDGHLMLVADYAAIELRTLAAVLLRRYGKSVLADVIRSGKDPHCYGLAVFRNETYEHVYEQYREEKKRSRQGGPGPFPYTDYRQKIKAISFGVPGGLGAKGLVAYAKATYGVALTLDEAVTLRDRLVTEIYPELNPTSGYLASTASADLCRNLNIADRARAYKVLRSAGDNVGLTLRCMEKVLKDQAVRAVDGKPYEEKFVDRLWSTLEGLTDLSRGLDDETRDLIQRRAAGMDLYRRVFGGLAVTLTGRIRGRCEYTQQKNGPFQSLAADGAKVAMYRLVREGYRVVGFLHDELLVELPRDTAQEQAGRVVALIEESMAEVLSYELPVETEWLLSESWSKG